MKHWTDKLVGMRACMEAVKWARDYDTLAEAWVACSRGDWMLWLAGKLSGKPESESRKRLVLAACGCARLALPYVKAGEERPLKAIETAEAWARGESRITLGMVRETAAAAYAATDAYATAYAAADAADAADAAAYAAAAAYSAYAAADAAVRQEALRQCADIVRQHYPEPPELG